MGDNHSRGSNEERDDLAAVLDFSVPERPALPADEQAAATAFTVTNPPGSVTVSADPDGRVRRIELSPRASGLTERELAAEIVVIAGLAAQDARAAQYAMVLKGMRERGHDDAATRDFLRRDLDLPSPEQAQADRARVFSARYSGDHD